jgi:hypothetical protein
MLGDPLRILRPLLATALAAATLSAASPALADEPVRPSYVDPDVYPPSGTQLNLALVGLGATAAWYGAAAGFSYLWPDAPGANDLRIPVAGPWMALADTGCADDDPGCSKFVVVIRAILTTLDAVGQTGGVLVAGEAIFMPTQEVAAEPRRKPLPRLRREQSFSLTPVPVLSGRDGVGLGVVGHF